MDWRVRSALLPSLTLLIATTLLRSDAGLAQSPTQPSRHVESGALISAELPPARLMFNEQFRYLGGQTIDLYGVARAEQHVFVKELPKGTVASFYWIQFEHYLPDNASSYEYPIQLETDFGPIHFVYDTKSFADFDAVLADDPRSDGFAIRALLERNGLRVPKHLQRVRMFHLPSPDHRSELMIIYGESIPEGSAIPSASNGLVLDTASPAFAHQLMERAHQNLRIEKP